MNELEYLDDFELDMAEVKEHYTARINVARNAKQLLESREDEKYVNLALGISDPIGNYSASEHNLGLQVLNNNSIEAITELARCFSSGDLEVHQLPKKIYEANLSFLKIGIGSEMATLLRPSSYWIGNVRTIYCHLLIKHKGNSEVADEELRLYRTDHPGSEMAYRIWKDIYLSMEHSLDVIYHIAKDRATKQGIEIGGQRFLWLDAVCNSIYAG